MAVSKTIATGLLGLALAIGLGACGDEAQDAAVGSNPAAASSAARPLGGMNHDSRGPGGSGSATTPAGSTPSAADERGAAVDAAFVRQMIPHHEQAIAMAELGRSWARHAELKALVDDIATTQSAELRTLKAAAKRLGVDLAASHDETQMTQDALTLGMTTDQLGMSMGGGGAEADLEALERASNFDAAFVDAMTEHHYGAVAMTNGEILHGRDDALKQLASDIGGTQTRELQQMAVWKGRW